MDIGKKKFNLVTFLIPVAALLLFWSVFWPKHIQVPTAPSFKDNGSLSFENGKKITIEVADSDEKRTQGLSYRSSLPNDSGLYFIFPQENQHVFWMKDMIFPIDIVWIKDDHIVRIDQAEVENVDPPIERYIAPEPLSQVLEIPLGKSEEWGIKVGDRVLLEY